MRTINSAVILLILLAFAPATRADLITLSGSADYTPSASIEDAKVALRNGKLAECRAFLATHCQQHADSPNPEILLASLLLEAKQKTLANRVLTELLRNPEVAFEAHFALSRFAVLEQRWADAWAHCRIAEIEARPTTWSQAYMESVDQSLHRHKAEIAFARRDWDVALPLLQQILKGATDDVTIHRKIAIVLFEQGNIEQARNAFQHAAQLDGTDETPYQIRLARLHIAEGDDVQAEECFKQSISQLSSHPMTGKIEYAEWLISKNRPAEAEELLLPIRDHERFQAKRDTLLGMAHRMQNDFDAAERVFTRLHQSNTNSLSIGNQLALVLIESPDEGKRARALQIASSNFRRIKNESTVSTLAWIQYRLGDISRARELFVRLAKSSQLSPDSAFYFSEILRSSGQTREAEQLAELARNASGPRFASLP